MIYTNWYCYIIARALFKWLEENQYQVTTPTNQSEFLAITCNLLLVREKVRLQGVSCFGFGFGFGFASYWLKNWRKSHKPITKLSNRTRSRLITFVSRFKFSLMRCQRRRSELKSRGLKIKFYEPSIFNHNLILNKVHGSKCPWVFPGEPCSE